MKVPGDLGQVADGSQQVIGHVVREVGDELDPFDSGDRVNPIEQVGQPAATPIWLPIMIAVDGLAEEGDLLDALVGKQAALRPGSRRVAGSVRVRGPRGRCSRCKTCRTPS